MTKTPKTPGLPAAASNESPPVLLDAPGSASLIRELYEQPEFRLAWDNDLHLQIALAVGRLRHYRDLTQSELAEAADTTQARIARVEGADQNLTIRALMRIVEALDGRLRFAIEPAELHIPRMPPWWECLAQGLVVLQPHRWTSHIVASNQQHTGRPTAALAGWKTDEFMVESGVERIVARTRAELPAAPDEAAAFSPENAEAEHALLKDWSWS